MQTIPNQPCCPGAGPLKEENAVTDGAGHLQNVVVWLEGAPPAPQQVLPAALLDQKFCQYIPHVVTLRTRQTLRVTSSDPTLHNVHGLCMENPPFNFALIAGGQTKDLTFDRAEVFQVRCDVHPWMKAYVHVFDHPYFAVTDRSGSFEIKNVPSGSYTLAAWQETYGVQRARVSAGDSMITQADFIFQSGL